MEYLPPTKKKIQPSMVSASSVFRLKNVTIIDGWSLNAGTLSRKSNIFLAPEDSCHTGETSNGRSENAKFLGKQSNFFFLGTVLHTDKSIYAFLYVCYSHAFFAT